MILDILDETGDDAIGRTDKTDRRRSYVCRGTYVARVSMIEIDVSNLKEEEEEEEESISKSGRLPAVSSPSHSLGHKSLVIGHWSHKLLLTFLTSFLNHHRLR